MTSKPISVSLKIFNINNRPAYVDMCIHELSKKLMNADYHYNYIKQKYDNKAKLLFTDTDSLKYEIERQDGYKDFQLIEKQQELPLATK